MSSSAPKSSDLSFLEIEHKFLVAADYDETSLVEQLRRFQPLKEYTTEVKDTYYLIDQLPAVVYRHRLDARLQQLTLKSLAGDNEARTEVNLELGLEHGDQSAAVVAFLQPLGIRWSGTLAKSVQVFYFADAEIVFYRARFAERQQACIEIEARQAKSLEQAQTILYQWELKLGLAPDSRCRASLLELLILPSLPSQIQQDLQKILV